MGNLYLHTCITLCHLKKVVEVYIEYIIKLAMYTTVTD